MYLVLLLKVLYSRKLRLESFKTAQGSMNALVSATKLSEAFSGNISSFADRLYTVGKNGSHSESRK